MTLDEYDQAMMRVASMQREANRLLDEARALRSATWKESGIDWHEPSTPGAPGWCIDGVNGYFSTPREAVAAKEKR
jgi:hypothetical protein